MYVPEHVWLALTALGSATPTPMLFPTLKIYTRLSIRSMTVTQVIACILLQLADGWVDDLRKAWLAQMTGCDVHRRRFYVCT